jgi:hypothetical protein
MHVLQFGLRLSNTMVDMIVTNEDKKNIKNHVKQNVSGHKGVFFHLRCGGELPFGISCFSCCFVFERAKPR